MTAQHDLVLERVFDAPPEKVFKAWDRPDNPAAVVRAPALHHAEGGDRPAPGGVFNILMMSEDGTEYPNPASSWRSCRTAGW